MRRVAPLALGPFASLASFALALFASASATAAASCGGGDGLIDLLPASSDGGDASSDGAATTDGALDAASDGGGASGDAQTEACSNGACACGLTSCGAAGCFDLANDPAHCNSCTQGCIHNAFCFASQCHCLAGFTSCNGTCLHLASDPNHCGACNAPPCALGDKCENSACATGACTAGLTGCDVGGRTACVDLASGTPFCGNCGVVCAPDEVCVAGTCRVYAPATPCTSCPCAADCARAVGSPASCCPPIAGATVPICVRASACP